MYFSSNQEKELKDVRGSYTYFQDDDVILAKITPCFENGKLGIAKNLKNKSGSISQRTNPGSCKTPT